MVMILGGGGSSLARIQYSNERDLLQSRWTYGRDGKTQKYPHLAHICTPLKWCLIVPVLRTIDLAYVLIFPV